MKGWFICPTCGHVVGTRGRGPILCKDGHKGERMMDFVGEGEEGKQEAENHTQGFMKLFKQNYSPIVKGEIL